MRMRPLIKDIGYIVLKAFVFVFYLVLVYVLVGCAMPCGYKEVKIPTKCDIPKRERPAKSNNTSQYFKEVLIYTEGLEKDLQFCREGLNE